MTLYHLSEKMVLLSKIRLHRFRNYEDVSISFSPGLNVIWGNNGQGKTNLLEAIYLLMIGRSFRTSRTPDLFPWSQDRFFFELEFLKHGIPQSLSYGMVGDLKKITYNQTFLRSRSQLIGILPGIFMPPDDPLIKGSPQFRRQFLDILLAQIEPLYFYHLSRYVRANQQRNYLLRSKISDGIEGWEEIMSISSVYIVEQRKYAINQLMRHLQNIYQSLSGESSKIRLHYVTKAETQENYLHLFKMHREKDLKVGNSTVGPHRDEINIFLGEQEVRTFGSEGQKRTFVAVLRLAAWHLLKEELELLPLLMIDDLDASLDQTRRENFLKYTQKLGQVFITSTEQPKEKGIRIENGKIGKQKNSEEKA